MFSSKPSFLSLPPTCFFTFHTWTLFLAFCLLLLFFPKSCPPSLFLCSPSPSAPSITHSLLLTSPSLCYLLSVCPCSVSPLAHLSLSPFCLLPPCPMSTHTSNTSLFFFLCVSLISILLSLFCILVMLHEIHTWTQGPGQDLTDVLFSPHAADRHCSKKILWQESSKKNWILLSWHFILWVFAYSSDKTEQALHNCVCACAQGFSHGLQTLWGRMQHYLTVSHAVSYSSFYLWITFQS